MKKIKEVDELIEHLVYTDGFFLVEEGYISMSSIRVFIKAVEKVMKVAITSGQKLSGRIFVRNGWILIVDDTVSFDENH